MEPATAAQVESQQTDVLQPSQNIYERYIIPYIEAAEEGDEILFMTPSTFFGFYSVGARTFQRVCELLREAKERKVEVRLIVDVHDSFAAKAAEGLVSFLRDGHEIMCLSSNTSQYYIMVYKKKKPSLYVAFTSEKPLALEFLPGIQCRPYRGLKNPPREDFTGRDAECCRDEFYDTWSRRCTLVRPAIASHSVAYQARSHLIRMQNISLLGVFAAGAGLGYLIHEQVSTNWKSWSVAVGLIVSVGVGILTNILSTALAKRFPRDEP